MQTAEGRTSVARETARHNVVTGLALVVLAAFFFWNSYSISLDFVDEEGIGPRFFPQAIAVVLGILGLILAGSGVLGRAAPADKTSFEARRFWLDAVPLFLLSLVFVWLFKSFGYLVATLILIAVGLLVFSARGRALWLTPPIAAILLYLVFFRLMRIYEPPAAIFNPLTFLS
ncbi:MAG: tripartite tricarboxylate transporter TctB family protein [Pseudomonadota bacterium]